MAGWPRSLPDVHSESIQRFGAGEAPTLEEMQRPKKQIRQDVGSPSVLDREIAMDQNQFNQMMAAVTALGTQFTTLADKVERLDTRVERFDAKFDRIDQKFDQLPTKDGMKTLLYEEVKSLPPMPTMEGMKLAVNDAVEAARVNLSATIEKRPDDNAVKLIVTTALSEPIQKIAKIEGAMGGARSWITTICVVIGAIGGIVGLTARFGH